MKTLVAHSTENQQGYKLVILFLFPRQIVTKPIQLFFFIHKESVIIVLFLKCAHSNFIINTFLKRVKEPLFSLLSKLQKPKFCNKKCGEGLSFVVLRFLLLYHIQIFLKKYIFHQ